MKPTYGRVSRFGVTPLSWSLDHVGPMTKTVVDTAIMLQVIAGSDPKDPTSLKQPVPNYLEALTGDIHGLKVGVPRNYFFDIIDKEVEGAINKAIDKLNNLGSEVTEVTFKNMRHVPSSRNIITSCEAASYHDRFFDIHSQDYDPRVITNRILPGRLIPAVYYLKAQRFRSIFTKEMEKLFKLVDVFVTPTTPIPAFNIEEYYVKIGTEKVNARNALGRLTQAFNLSGLPSITVPCGFTSLGLPIGLQIIAKRFEETTALRVAHTYEINTPWHKQRPKIKIS
jgi:aspartyl-tRNA(Asn)/glutamyl-tRNA(Gln) amidotransferase subunit A